MAGLGCRGLKARGSEGPGRIAAAVRGWACLAKILFLVLSEGRGSRAGHRSPRSQWVAGALPALTQSLASVCLEAAYFQPFPPGQGSRAGHDLTQQPRPRCGHPVRPGHSVSNACSPEVALNHTGSGARLALREQQFAGCDSQRWEGPGTRRGGGLPLLTHLWKVSWVEPGGCWWWWEKG